MTTPGWLTLALLIGAATRTYRIVGVDTILDRPRHWILGLPRNWKDGDRIPANYRPKLDVFLACPWCAGFWISLAWWGAWELWPHAATVASAPFAISMVVGLVVKNLDKSE